MQQTGVFTRLSATWQFWQNPFCASLFIESDPERKLFQKENWMIVFSTNQEFELSSRTEAASDTQRAVAVSLLELRVENVAVLRTVRFNPNHELSFTARVPFKRAYVEAVEECVKKVLLATGIELHIAPIPW